MFTIEPFEQRRLLSAALSTDVFAQADDRYTLALTPSSGAAVPETAITSLQWSATGGSSTSIAGELVVTLPTGQHSSRFLQLALAGSALNNAEIRQFTSEDRLRTLFDFSDTSTGGRAFIRGYSQFTGPDSLVYDRLRFAVTFMRIEYFTINPNTGAETMTFAQHHYGQNAGSGDTTLFSNGYMSTSDEVRNTIELAGGQLPVKSWAIDIDTTAAPVLTGPSFTTVASGDATALFRRLSGAGGTAITPPVVFTTRGDDGVAASRTVMGYPGIGTTSVTRYGFFDTVLDDQPRVDEYTLRSSALMLIDYTYGAGSELNEPTSTGWNFFTQASFTRTPLTAHIRPPVSGPANTPINSVQIELSHPVSGLTLSDFTFDGLTSAGLSLTTSDDRVFTLSGLAAQQTTDRNYGVKLFAIPSGVVSIASPTHVLLGSAGRQWTLDTAAPFVADSMFDFTGTLPRPYVFAFALSEPVTAAPGGVPVLIRRVDNGQLVATATGTLSSDGQTLDAALTAPLPDGNYRATVPAGALMDAAGNVTQADTDLPFFVLAADANRNRSVNLDDFTILAANFGQTGRVFGQGNFNYSTDGAVNLDDFTILAAQFGKTLPAAGELPRAGRLPVGGVSAAGSELGGKGGVGLFAERPLAERLISQFDF